MFVENVFKPADLYGTTTISRYLENLLHDILKRALWRCMFSESEQRLQFGKRIPSGAPI